MNEQGEVMSVDAFNQYSPKKEQDRLKQQSWRTWKPALRKVARGLNQARRAESRQGASAQ
jgi:hypothetical protein